MTTTTTSEPTTTTSAPTTTTPVPTTTSEPTTTTSEPTTTPEPVGHYTGPRMIPIILTEDFLEELFESGIIPVL